jgi:hypothetical protein
VQSQGLGREPWRVVPSKGSGGEYSLARCQEPLVRFIRDRPVTTRELYDSSGGTEKQSVARAGASSLFATLGWVGQEGVGLSVDHAVTGDLA